MTSQRAPYLYRVKKKPTSLVYWLRPQRHLKPFRTVEISIDFSPFRYTAHKLLKSGCTPVTLQAGGPAPLFQAVNLLTSEGQNKFSCLLQLHLHFPRVFFRIKVQFISFITIQSLFLNHCDQRTKFKLFTSDFYANGLQNRNASGQDNNQKKTFFFFFFTEY